MDLCSCLPPGSSDINFASCQTWKALSRLRKPLKSCNEHPRPDSGLLKEAQGRRLPLRPAPTFPPCRCLQVDPEALWQPWRSKAVCQVLQAVVDIIFSLQQKSRLQELCPSVFCDQLLVVAPRRAEARGPSGEHHSEVCWSRTPSQLVPSISKNGDSTPSLGNLVQCLTTLTVKKCFLMLNHYMPCFSLFPLPPILSLGTQE